MVDGVTTPATGAETPSLVNAEDDAFVQEAITAALDEENANGKATTEPTKSSIDSDDEPEAKTVKERPESVPEKFWDAEKGEAKWEELAKSYSELEKKLGEKKPDEDGKALEAKNGEGKIDFTPFVEEFAKSGDISEASRANIAKALTEAGVDGADQLVAEYIEGAKARHDIELGKFQAEVFTMTEGASNYQEMAKWAMEKLTKEERAEFDEDVTSGNIRLAKRAVKDLYARFRAEGEELPAKVEGKKGGQGTQRTGSTVGYDSYEQMYADMQDPRYDKDPAYRDAVDRKIERTLPARD